MLGNNIRIVLVWGIVFLTLLGSGSLWTGSSDALERRGSDEGTALSSDLQRKEEKIDRAIGKVVEIGAALEESEVDVDQARARQGELGQRARALTEELGARKEEASVARSRLEEQIRASYKGRDLAGILLLVESLFGDKNAGSNSSTTRQAMLVLTKSNEDVQYYEDAKQKLRVTLRQLEQSKGEYRVSQQEDQALIEDLAGRQSELRRSIRTLGLERDQLGERLAELEAEEEAGLLKRPPASDGEDEPGEARDREDLRSDKKDRGNEEDRDSLEDRDEPATAEGRGAQDRQRELEISREDIVTRVVAPIPYEEYVRLYRESAERYGFGDDWYVLAAVGKIESNHGENMGPSSAGAMGPMQFLPSTWSSYGVDGDGDGGANIMDPKDAIPAAAAYLRAGGAPGDWYAALFTYNRAGWYVEEVLAIAESYRRTHGDDNVGPYLDPATDGPEDVPSRPDTPPAGTKEDPNAIEEYPGGVRPPDEAAPPTDEEPQPTDDTPDEATQMSPEPENTAPEDEVMTEQYQY